MQAWFANKTCKDYWWEPNKGTVSSCAAEREGQQLGCAPGTGTSTVPVKYRQNQESHRPETMVHLQQNHENVRLILFLKAKRASILKRTDKQTKCHLCT